MKKELYVKLVIHKDFTTHFTVAEHIIVIIYILYEVIFIDSTRSRGLRSESAATRLLRLRVQIPPEHRRPSFFFFFCCQVDGSASG
jgi:hypothetical protein